MTREIGKKANRIVRDAKGQPYELTGMLGSGGQGVVCTTSIPNVLAKIVRPGISEERRTAWITRVVNLMRRPLEGLHVAAPLALAFNPRTNNPVGYLMELMDGLEPLAELIEKVRDEGIESFVRSGGLRKRMKALARLARILAELHGRGLAFGDLSPSNVFVSKSKAHAEVWLIDCDNIDFDSSHMIYTPDYGAPEIVRDEAGISTLTDSWSYAVLAFRLLTLEHPLKGDLVVEGEPETEEIALQGDLPWVDHSTDRRNALSTGLPREVVLTGPLRVLFDRCFDEGMRDPAARPSMAEWADAFETSTARLVECRSCESTFHFSGVSLECPFCGEVQPEDHALPLRGYTFIPLKLLPEDMPQNERKRECWTKTGDVVVAVTGNPIELREFPPGTSLHSESRNVCSLRISEEGLWIEPALNAEVNLQAASGSKVARIVGPRLIKAASKIGAGQLLHLGPLAEPHTAWRFKW